MTDERRPAIPRAMARQVKDEAGYRCAIPTCRATSALEIAHIVPWSQVREHTFENLILLCAICHTRYDRGEIDRASIKNYKSNLAVLNHRYSEVEQRFLRTFHEHGLDATIEIESSAILGISLMNLQQDGLLTMDRAPGEGQVFIGGREVGIFVHLRLTEAGQDFTRRWFEAEPVIDDTDADDGDESDAPV